MLVEENLFFTQYNFHKQKIALHRASMKFYQQFLTEKGYTVLYINAQEKIADIRLLVPHLKKEGYQNICIAKVTDYLLNRRLQLSTAKTSVTIEDYDSPLFLNTEHEIENYFKGKKRFYQTDFYTSERKKRKILLEADDKPVGGKWSFDTENRLKYPKNKIPPPTKLATANKFNTEAFAYTNTYFKNNYGELNTVYYPCTFTDSEQWLQAFLQNRFAEFGLYEDAIVVEENFLNHSILTPMLNVGLLTPQQIITTALDYAKKNDIPLNSLEGFIRQIMGWREFIRAVYQLLGTAERKKNFWGFDRKIPASFWNATTGIAPIDITIKKVLQTGYCHHIERLMVLGNFMVLCEFDPDDVYRWFMEMFVDAYDWVMVPNVYGMSQFADGGLMATKPYISGSNYLFKMSDFQKTKKDNVGSSWEQIWDGLFWRFMHVNRSFFTKNPRLGMLVAMFDKMPEEKRAAHLLHAEKFLSTL